jgi:ERF superfamily
MAENAQKGPPVIESRETSLARLEPQELIRQAIDRGAPVETLERIFALAKDVRNEVAREAWFKSMAEFQRTCPSIRKTATAKIPSRSGGSGFQYRYSPLDEIVSTVQPIMGSLGLTIGWRSRVEPAQVVVSCRVSHTLGHTEDSGEIAIPISSDGSGANSAQRTGISLTYAKRYALLGVLGLAPEDDDDAASAGSDPEPRTRPREETLTTAELRDRLLVQIGECADAAQWTAAARRQLWHERFGDTRPEHATPAELAEFLAHVRELTK